MTFLDARRQVIYEQRAGIVNAALDGLQALSEGGEVNLDRFFGDLVSREPKLPEFLRKEKI